MFDKKTANATRRFKMHSRNPLSNRSCSGIQSSVRRSCPSLEGAIKCLQTRIDKLKMKTESIDPSKVRDAFYTRENEIKQIESLIPEIKEKIADTKDMKTETFKKLGDKRLMEEGIASAFGSAEAKKMHLDASTTSSSENGHTKNGN